MFEARTYATPGVHGGSLCFRNGNLLIAGIYDGHGGTGASSLVAKRLEDIFHQRPTVTSVAETLRDTFEMLHLECQTLPCMSACTLTVVVLDVTTGAYTCANVGDATALHVTPTFHMRTTVSHRLSEHVGERIRLRDFMHVTHNGPCLQPGALACSRAIGAAGVPHVQCQPSIHVDFLNTWDAMVVCTGDVWRRVSETRVADIVRATFHQPEPVCQEAQRLHTESIVVLVISRQCGEEPLPTLNSHPSCPKPTPVH